MPTMQVVGTFGIGTVILMLSDTLLNSSREAILLLSCSSSV